MTDRLATVLGYVEEHPGKTPQKIALALGLVEAHVVVALSDLRREGKVEPSGKRGWQAVKRQVP